MNDNDWEKLTCCWPLIDQIHKAARELSDAIHGHEDADAIRSARDKVICALDPFGRSSEHRLLMVVHLPLGDELPGVLKALWRSALWLCQDDYSWSSSYAEGFCNAEQRLFVFCGDFRSWTVENYDTADLATIADVDRIARRCLARNGCPTDIDLTPVEARNLVFLERQFRGKTRQEVLDEWNGLFPDDWITSKESLGSRQKDARDFIKKLKQAEKISP